MSCLLTATQPWQPRRCCGDAHIASSPPDYHQNDWTTSVSQVNQGPSAFKENLKVCWKCSPTRMALLLITWKPSPRLYSAGTLWESMTHLRHEKTENLTFHFHGML